MALSALVFCATALVSGSALGLPLGTSLTHRATHPVDWVTPPITDPITDPIDDALRRSRRHSRDAADRSRDAVDDAVSGATGTVSPFSEAVWKSPFSGASPVPSGGHAGDDRPSRPDGKTGDGKHDRGDRNSGPVTASAETAQMSPQEASDVDDVATGGNEVEPSPGDGPQATGGLCDGSSVCLGVLFADAPVRAQLPGVREPLGFTGLNLVSGVAAVAGLVLAGIALLAVDLRRRPVRRTGAAERRTPERRRRRTGSRSPAGRQVARTPNAGQSPQPAKVPVSAIVR